MSIHRLHCEALHFTNIYTQTILYERVYCIVGEDKADDTLVSLQKFCFVSMTLTHILYVCVHNNYHNTHTSHYEKYMSKF